MQMSGMSITDMPGLFIDGIKDMHGGGKNKCEFEGGCEKHAVHKRLCKAHGGKRKCEFEGGCDKPARSYGLCSAHGGVPKCQHASACENNAKYAGGLCKAHRDRKN